MKFTVTYYRNGKARTFRFQDLAEAQKYCARVFARTGIILGIAGVS